MKKITVLRGTYRGQDVINQTFELVKNITFGKKGAFITVKPNEEINFPGKTQLRINIDSEHDVEYEVKPVKQESDEEVMERIAERFDILHEMTRATVSNEVRAMIVTGPPGVGKSYGIINELEKANLFNNVKSIAPSYEIVKGATSAIGLYMTLYNYSSKDNVIVFDDCDVVLYDELSLNLLKAALDTGKKRKISWNSASSYLEKEGIPDTFDFEGSVIFITNVNFDNIRSAKLQDHLGALQSRCHYVNLTIETARDKYLRIKQIYKAGELFKNFNITKEQGEEIMEWIDENKDCVRELSLRLAIKAAELVTISPTRWKRMAIATLCK